MPSTTETGHAKNVVNFETLITNVTSFGATYNPSKAGLKLVNLTASLTLAKTELSNVSTKSVAFNNATNVRVQQFDTLKPLATRLINALKATDATKLTIADAKTINTKLQGKRAKSIEVPADPNTPPPPTISVSQQSYDQQAEHLSKFIDLLKAETSYSPNEAELKVSTLASTLTALKTANSAVTTTFTAVSNARISRNKTFYKDKTGICDIGQEIKNYVKSIYGASSAEYKLISKIKFTVPKI
jgi:hypothetical protein